MRSAAHEAASRLCVHTDEPRPNGDALARPMASSRSFTDQIGSTGPNTSSLATRESCAGRRMVGGSSNPRPSPPPPGAARVVRGPADDRRLVDPAALVEAPPRAPPAGEHLARGARVL